MVVCATKRRIATTTSTVCVRGVTGGDGSSVCTAQVCLG
jgi:hypothetical protein